MNNDLNVSIASFPIQFNIPALEPALQIKPAYEMEILEDVKGALNYLVDQPATLFIVPVHNKTDLSRLSILVRDSKKKNLKVKFVIVSRMGPQVDKFAAKLGILDFIEISTSTKALRYKLDYWVKSLKAQIKKDAVKEASKPKSVAEKEIQGEKRVSEFTPIWGDALDCADDMWLIKNEADCRRVLNKWLVRFRGPSPYVGKWVDSDIKGCWEFKLKDEENPFCGQRGKWYFRGSQKPEFIWKDNVWLLVGDQYELFYRGAQGIQSRASFQEKVLTVAKNSEYAKAKENAIIESFDKDLVYSAENPEGGRETLIEDDSATLEPLKGKGKTGHIDAGPLTGKQNSTDQIEADPLSGKGKTDDLSSLLLSRKLKEGEQDLGSDKTGMESGDELMSGAHLEDEKHRTEHIEGFYGKKRKVGDPSSEKGGGDDVYGPEAALAAKESRKSQQASEEEGQQSKRLKEEEKERKRRVAELKSLELEYSEKTSEYEREKNTGADREERLAGKSRTDDVTAPLLSTAMKNAEEKKKKEDDEPRALSLKELIDKKKLDKQQPWNKVSKEGGLDEETTEHGQEEKEGRPGLLTKEQKKREKDLSEAAALAAELHSKKQKKESSQEKPSKFASDADRKTNKDGFETPEARNEDHRAVENKSAMAGDSSTDHLDAFYGRTGKLPSDQGPSDELGERRQKVSHESANKIPEKLAKDTEKKKIKEAKEKDIVDQIVDEVLDGLDIGSIGKGPGPEEGLLERVEESDVHANQKSQSALEGLTVHANVVELSAARKSKGARILSEDQEKDHPDADGRQARLKAIFEKAAQQYKRANG